LHPPVETAAKSGHLNTYETNIIDMQIISIAKQ